MLKEYKPLTWETLEDALTLVRARFPASAVDIVRRALCNPSLKNGDSIGMIGYRDGRPVALQMEMLRWLHFAGRRILGVIGGMTCKAVRGCPLSVMLETVDRSYAAVKDVQVFFGNTCCSATAQLDAQSGSRTGPDSCTRHRFAVLRPLRFVAYLVRRKILKLPIPDWASALPDNSGLSFTAGKIRIVRLDGFDTVLFGDFWESYLKRCEGLVLSRSVEELRWLFGDRVRSSRCVILGAMREDRLLGYVILTAESDAARRWAIGDLIAIGNDASVIGVLLKGAKKFLKCKTPAMLLETIGFPTFIQPMLGRHLPYSRSAGCNFFSYAFADTEVRSKCEKVLDSPQSWFFGPYDGDMCM